MAPFIKIFSAISHALNPSHNLALTHALNPVYNLAHAHALNPAHALALNLALVLTLALTHALNPAHNLTHALALNLSSIVPLLVNYWSTIGQLLVTNRSQCRLQAFS